MFLEKGKKNMVAGGGDQKSSKAKSGFQKSGNPIKETVHVDKELAKTAGVSHDTIHKAEYLSEHADEETKENLRQGKTTVNKEYKRAKEKAADSKPKTTRTKKANKELPVTKPETPKASKNVPCIDELEPYDARTTLQNIRQNHPDHLLANLRMHFRDGYIADLVIEAMADLHKHEGEKVTTPIVQELVKIYLKTKR
jgi:O-succinylbenzoate synthase